MTLLENEDFQVQSGNQIEALNLYECMPHFITEGYIPCAPLYDQGVDIVMMKEGENSKPDLILKVQAKSRFTLNKKYFGRNIWMLFPNNKIGAARDFYFCPHDLMVDRFPASSKETKSWQEGGYSILSVKTEGHFEYLKQFKLPNVLAQLSASELNRLIATYAKVWQK